MMGRKDDPIFVPEGRKGDPEVADTPPSAWRAAGAGALSGLTANWDDEIVSGLRAFNNRAEGESYGDAFTRLQKLYTADNEKLKEAYPWTYGAANVAGGVGGAIAVPGSLTSRGAAIMTGGLSGALSGAGEGNTADERIRGAGTGALIGSTAGAILPELGRLATTYAAPVGRAFDDMGTKALGWLGVGAERRVASTLRNAAAARGQTPEEFADLAESQLRQARAAKQPAVLGDVAPTEAGRLVQESANLSPKAQATTVANLSGRQGEPRVNRFRDMLSEKVGGAKTDAERLALKKQSQEANDPLYKAAYEAHPEVWDEALEGLTLIPEVKAAIADVGPASLRRSAWGKGREIENPFTEGAGGQLVLKPGAKPPGLDFWDQVQRNIKEQSEGLPHSGIGVEKPGQKASEILGLRSGLVEHLDKVAPKFAEARGEARRFFGLDDALDIGKHLAGKGLSAEEYDTAKRAIEKLGPADRRLAQASFLDQISHEAGGAGDNANVAVRAFGSQNRRDAARALFGEVEGDTLGAYSKFEEAMQAFSNASRGGPSTTRQATDVLRQASPGAVAGLATLAHSGPTPAAAGAAALGLVAGLTRAGMVRGQASRIARVMTSGEPDAEMRVFEMLRREPSLRAAFNKLTIPAAIEGTEAVQEAAEPLRFNVSPREKE